MGLKVSVSGEPLPSAREVADKMIGGAHQGLSEDMSVHVMQWGQFVTHDLDHTPEVSPPPGDWDCCGEHRDTHACAPIFMDGTDSIYGPANMTCMGFVRSALAPTTGCKVDQQNQITSYIDGSMIYGSDDETVDKARLYKEGLLARSGDDESDLLQQSNETACNIPQPTDKRCFFAGDKRVNVQPGITLYQTLWHRYVL